MKWIKKMVFWICKWESLGLYSIFSIVTLKLEPVINFGKLFTTQIRALVLNKLIEYKLPLHVNHLSLGWSIFDNVSIGIFLTTSQLLTG